MDSVIVSDYGVMLAKKGERLVIRGPKPPDPAGKQTECGRSCAKFEPAIYLH